MRGLRWRLPGGPFACSFLLGSVPKVGPEMTRQQLGTTQWKRGRPAIFARDLWTCVACGDTATVVGHRIPAEFYEGSHNDPTNLIALCRPCNVSMQHQAFDDWIALEHGRPAMLRAQGRLPSVRPSARTSFGHRRHAYPYHVCSAGPIANLSGDMSIRPRWDGPGCPPSCPRASIFAKSKER
jgi:5-methylcytosine-specific restriction endonuclease McrA